MHVLGSQGIFQLVEEENPSTKNRDCDIALSSQLVLSYKYQADYISHDGNNIFLPLQPLTVLSLTIELAPIPCTSIRVHSSLRHSFGIDDSEDLIVFSTIGEVGEKLAEQTASEVSASKSASEKRQQSSKKSGRKRKNLGPRQSAVQRLFETCKEVFANGGPGIVPSPEDVDRLRSILDNVDASDVGLTPKMPYFRHGASEGRPPITYLHIYKCDKFSICIFCLPPSGVIPLHNHPGMTVFSKLLFGSLHVKSYDWVNLPQDSAEIVDPLHFQPPGLRLAKVKTDGTYTAPCRTSVLFPQDGGNLHCFTARTSCAVLDVLGPPYSNPEEGRDCTYYNDSPYASFCGDAELLTDDGEYAWLEERKKPDEFIVVGANYSGPKIMDQ